MSTQTANEYLDKLLATENEHGKIIYDKPSVFLDHEEVAKLVVRDLIDSAIMLGDQLRGYKAQIARGENLTKQATKDYDTTLRDFQAIVIVLSYYTTMDEFEKIKTTLNDFAFAIDFNRI